MKNNTLHLLRTPSTPLRYALVLSLLLSIGLSIFADWDNPAHVLKTDQHCALCLYSDSIDNSFPPKIPYFALLPNVIVQFAFESQSYLLKFTNTTGNRDPPL
jgi:hypothetical protein